MERLIDPDSYLKSRVPMFVANGDFGLASGQQPGGGYSRLWFQEMVSADEITFDADVYLLLKSKAKDLKAKPQPTEAPAEPPVIEPEPATSEPDRPGDSHPCLTRTLHISGSIPPELWNRLGTKLIPKLRSGTALRIGLDFTIDIPVDQLATFQSELRQALQDLNLGESVTIGVS
jgi:hypothetical protein